MNSPYLGSHLATKVVKVTLNTFKHIIFNL